MGHQYLPHLQGRWRIPGIRGSNASLPADVQEVIDSGKAIPAVVERVEGRGYSGGHMTAVKHGWATSHPTDKGQEPFLHSWDSTTQGAFTGYYPARSYLRTEEQVAEREAAAQRRERIKLLERARPRVINALSAAQPEEKFSVLL